MSKCWYCNNELTTGDNPKHFGICNKCYDEMFKSSDTIIRSFTNKIADLASKLAEKEKENNELEFIVEEIEQFAWEQLNNDNFDKYKAYDEMYTKIKQLTKNSPYEKQHQDKISFCIEHLEKVKEKILSYEEIYYQFLESGAKVPVVCLENFRVRQTIDNQIAELKKGVE